MGNPDHSSPRSHLAHRGPLPRLQVSGKARSSEPLKLYHMRPGVRFEACNTSDMLVTSIRDSSRPLETLCIRVAVVLSIGKQSGRAR